MLYKDEYLNEISFPVGGIGSGSIGLTGNGQLFDWEIFNKPSKGSLNGYTHIAVKAITKDKIIPKILNSDLKKDLVGQYSKAIFSGYGFGPKPNTMCGLPHFKECEFTGEFPIANLRFTDECFPGEVTLTAFNPFIPLDCKNSSIPAAFYEITFKNTSDCEIKYEAVFSLANPFEVSKNIASIKDGISSVKLICADKDEDEKDYGDLSLSCCDPTIVEEYWYRGRWQDGIVTYWNEFSSDKGLSERTYDTNGSHDTCSISKIVTVEANASKSVKFVVSWNIPNNYNYWLPLKDENEKNVMWKNYYATVFKDSSESGAYSLKNWDDLYNKTLKFKEELFSSTVDEAILDAVSSTISVLKSPTVMRLENGEFYGFEGVNEEIGSCEGTCQHVWNYAYALCFLFPELERSIRELEFKYCTYESGEMKFRLPLPLGRDSEKFRACLDGQMGAVIKTYREWKISGDDNWLKKVWCDIEKIMDYAWSTENADEWDLNKDGVLEGRQHHTLDMELFGPSSWLEGFYLCALKAMWEMSDRMGFKEKADMYLSLFKKGQSWTKENLFNGKYFIQKIDLSNKSITDHFDCNNDYWNDETKEIKYQIGEGSEIDQLCGQWHANICGLGKIFDDKQIKTALSNMYKNNYKTTMRNFANPWRIFALNDESGSVICDYPADTYKPKIPIAYCEESMHGFEYQFAGMLVSEGFIEEGLTVVKAVRNRYNGKNRNPWNELECGSNYARSMASFALLPLLSGFVFDLPNQKIGFNPVIKNKKFRCIWSLGSGWGNVIINCDKTTVNVVSGSITLNCISLPYISNPSRLFIDGKELEFTYKDGELHFESSVIYNNVEVIL